jgi:anti-sigma28 factor (negative regulator of flagellin synthesis)
MIEKIDLEGLTPSAGPKKKAAAKETPAKNSPDIAISSHIREVVTTLVAENKESPEMDRVKAIKSMIDSNQYKIDADALAQKLYRSLFSKNMEI